MRRLRRPGARARSRGLVRPGARPTLLSRAAAPPLLPSLLRHARRPPAAPLALHGGWMPPRSGLEVARQVRQRAPETRVIVLSMHANEAYVLEALRHGAAAYILKETSSAELVQAIRAVVAGRRYLSRPLSERALAAYAQRAEATPLDLYETLTTREREVLHLAVEGCSNTDIAARLSISPRTAETHRTNLMRKLGLQSQTELVRYALRRGIIPMEP